MKLLMLLPKGSVSLQQVIYSSLGNVPALKNQTSKNQTISSPLVPWRRGHFWHAHKEFWRPHWSKQALHTKSYLSPGSWPRCPGRCRAFAGCPVSWATACPQSRWRHCRWCTGRRAGAAAAAVAAGTAPSARWWCWGSRSLGDTGDMWHSKLSSRRLPLSAEIIKP